MLQRVAAGDQQAFATRYNYYLPRLYRYVLPFVQQSQEETEEILQDTFFSIWLKKESLPALQQFEPYLLRMTRNRIIDVLRKNKQHQLYLSQQSASPTPLATNPEEALTFKEYNQVAQHALRDMTDKRKLVFELHSQHDKTLEEIGKTLGIPRSAAQKHLHATTRLIKKPSSNTANGSAAFASCSPASHNYSLHRALHNLPIRSASPQSNLSQILLLTNTIHYLSITYNKATSSKPAPTICQVRFHPQLLIFANLQL